MQEIKLYPLPNQVRNVVLDGQHCTFRLYQKEAHLYLDLWVDERAVCAGAICRNGADILQSPSPYFKGGLHFFDLAGTADPCWQSLGERHIFLYRAQDEDLPLTLRF